MSKTDDVRKAMMAAMKSGDKPRKDALSMLLAALKSKQIDKRAELTPEEEDAVEVVKAWTQARIEGDLEKANSYVEGFKCRAANEWQVRRARESASYKRELKSLKVIKIDMNATEDVAKIYYVLRQDDGDLKDEDITVSKIEGKWKIVK